MKDPPHRDRGGSAAAPASPDGCTSRSAPAARSDLHGTGLDADAVEARTAELNHDQSRCFMLNRRDVRAQSETEPDEWCAAIAVRQPAWRPTGSSRAPDAQGTTLPRKRMLHGYIPRSGRLSLALQSAKRRAAVDRDRLQARPQRPTAHRLHTDSHRAAERGSAASDGRGAAAKPSRWSIARPNRSLCRGYFPRQPPTVAG